MSIMRCWALWMLLFLWLGVSTMSYNDEKATLKEYCLNVETGTWPDYKGIYHKECNVSTSP